MTDRDLEQRKKDLLTRRAKLSTAKQTLLERRLQGTDQDVPTLPIARVARDEPLPLSLAQQRLWFLDQLEPGNAAYNISAAVRLQGTLDVSALERSLNEISRRHEILRTTFALPDEQPIQLIAPAAWQALPGTNLAELAPPDREARARQLIAEEAQCPFDLTRGPLLRNRLLRLDEQDHILILTMHHIISDGWSMGVLVRELATLYQAFSAGQPSPLPDLSIQYVDYAAWQRQWLTGEVLEQRLGYWKRQLSGALPVLDLPTDHPRPPIQTFRGAIRHFQISRDLTDRLKTLSRQHEGTLFMTLLAAFQTLLQRYTGQTDLIVGAPIANRGRAETEDLIGFFVNTLALRVDLSGDPTFVDALERVREVTLGAYAHQDLPFDRLVEELHLPRDLSRTPLFQVMLVLQNAPMPSLESADLKLTALETESGTANFDLTLSLTETAQGLYGALEYNADLFEAATIQRMTTHWLTLLNSLLQQPDQHLADLEILAASERQQLLVEWNSTQTPYTQAACIHHLFEAQVERTPDAVAVVFPAADREQAEDHYLTYAALNQRANQLAHQLRQLGTGPDVLVGICLERSLEMVVGLFGILKAGGAYVPIDPTYPQDRRAFMLADAQVTVLLTQQQWLTDLAGQATHVICLDTNWDTVATHSLQNPNPPLLPAHLAYMIYTSGSTGKPKGAMNTHAGIRNRLLWMQDTYQLTQTDRVLQKTPFSFDVSVWEFFWPLLTGACLVVARPEGHKDSHYLVQTILEQNITTLHFVPSMLHVFLEESDLETCRSLKHVICSGEALSPDLVQRFLARLPAGLHNLYGPTEAAVDVTFWACSGGKPRSIIPIGRPIANTHLHVLDAHLRPVPIGVAGELCIGGVNVGRGYWQRPDLTAERFIPHPFSAQPGERLYRTGDLARYLPDGNLEFLGRLDHQVKVRGFRIELGEIETVLTQHPAIQQTAVIIREVSGPGSDKQLVAYLVSQGIAPDTSELRRFLQQQLPDYMVPAIFVTLDALPLTPNGKVDRRALPAPDDLLAVARESYMAPRTPLEEELTAIWVDILHLERVGIHDDFFAIGGHSLLATQVMTRIRQRVQVTLPLPALFQSPTIALLAEKIELLRWAAQDQADLTPSDQTAREEGEL